MDASMADENVLEFRKNWLQSNGGEIKTRVKRVLIGDASTFTLHPSLAAAFKGAKNQTDAIIAQLKLQLTTDLLTGKWVHFTFDLYGRSDAKAALDFMPFIKAGDLLLRDLGYATIPSFKAIKDKDAFFISRLPARFSVLDKNGKKMNLLKSLQQLTPKAGDIVRLQVKLTESDKMPCVLVAKRVPKIVANLRRRKLRAKNKKKGTKPPTKRYLQLQDWTIMITNLEPSDASDEQIFQWYEMRWRIENIFKACKSHTSWLQVSRHKTNENHAKALILSWFLAMVILADRGAFRMARIRRENDRSTIPETGSQPLEFINFSILKSIGKLLTSFGFQLEFLGCGCDGGTHHMRMMHYMEKHNTTELQLNRVTLVELLELTLEGDF